LFEYNHILHVLHLNVLDGYNVLHRACSIHYKVSYKPAIKWLIAVRLVEIYQHNNLAGDNNGWQNKYKNSLNPAEPGSSSAPILNK